MEERLQKILARSGFGSRRDCEALIAAGRVTVNLKPVELGTKVDPKKDRIEVDGEWFQYKEPKKVYYMLNKPRFVLSDHVPDDPRRSVYSLAPDIPGLAVVGRLDFESEGLILLTNDGDIVEKLTHPRYGKEKEYQVLLAKHPDDRQLKAWRHGVVLENGDKTAPAHVVISSLSGKGAWVRVVMTEGRKRQIREICQTIGLPVVRLVRVRIGNLELGDLATGECRELSEKQVNNLRALVNGKWKKEQGETPSRAPKDRPFKKSGPSHGPSRGGHGGRSGSPSRRGAPVRKPKKKVM